MASVNKIILLGTVTVTPDFRVLRGGSMMVRLQMETMSESGTQSHEVRFYGRLGEIAMQYLKAGSIIYIEGKLRYEKYTDKNGTSHQKTGIVAQKMQMFSHKKAVSDANDLFPDANLYKKAKDGSCEPPDLSRFEYDDW